MSHHLPRDIRFRYSRRGELSYKDARFPCLIQDISAKGLFIICARDPKVGQELGVRFELTSGHIHQCKIRVQHIDNGCFGAEITEAGEQENKVFLQFVEKCFRESRSLQSTI